MSYKGRICLKYVPNMSQICLILYIVLAPSRAHYAQGTNARAHAHYSNGTRNFLVASK